MSVITPSTPTQQAPRHDVYGPIHKALRLFIGDTLSRIGRLDCEDPAELAETGAQLESLIQVLRAHLEHENEFVHPLMQARAPGSAARAGAEHHDHVEALAALELELLLLRQRPGATQAGRLYRALALLLADNLVHMDMEESQHQPCLWQHYSDAELEQMHDRLLASIPPAEMMLVLGWMLPALAPRERAGMLMAMRENAPPPVFDAVLALARAKIDARGYAKLERALQLSPAVPDAVAA